MKIVGWIVGLLVVVVGGTLVYLVFNSGNLIKQAIETLGPEYLGTTVTVDSVNLSIAEGTGEIYGLVIGNPRGFDGDYAMRLNLIKVVLDPAAISEELIVVKHLIIDGADIAAEVKGRDSNLQALLATIEQTTGSTETVSEPEIKIIIDKLDFTNARTSVVSDFLGNAELDIPDIYLTDIGRKSDGVTAGEAAKQVLRPITDAVTKGLLAQGLGVDDLKQRAEETVHEKIGEKLKSFTDRLNRDD